MPNIRTYNAGDLALHPSDRGTDAALQGARTIGNLYDDIGSAKKQAGNAWASSLGEGIAAAGQEAVRFMDHQEISRGMPAAANLMLELQNKANEITKNADPNDPSVYGKFRDEVLEPALEKFQESFNTEKSQNWALGQTDNIREHMQRKISADISTMAANAVKLNLNQTANIASNTVAQDPTSLPTVLDLLAHSTKETVASSPNISADDAARVSGEVLQKLNENVVKAAIQGAILKNPEAGLKMAQDPRYAKYVDGAAMNMFAREVVRAQKTDYDMARMRARQELEDRSQANLTTILQNLYDPNETEKVTAREIAQLPADQMRPGDREHAIKLIEAELKPESDAKRSALVADSALAGIRRGTLTMDDIYKLKEDGKVTRADFTFLQNQFTSYHADNGDSLPAKRGAFVNTFRHVIDSSNDFTGTTDEIGKRHLWDFEQELVRRENILRASGHDPHSLYDPRSPDYMGSPEALAPYKKTAAEEQAAALDKVRGNIAPPRREPEDIPTVKSAADVAKLPATARYFMTPDGRRKLNPNYQAQ